MDEFFRTILNTVNETLAAAIVIVTASLLLYDLTRNLKNRVTRTSAAVLGCVTITYVGDVLLTLNPTLETQSVIIRFQWIGITFIPAATFHLSDALLATTGLPSRGRRKRVVRILYLMATAFLVLATFTDDLVNPQRFDGLYSAQDGVLFPLFMAYLFPVELIALINVWRARQRCLTHSTQRRMTYLLIALLMPTIGIFPYAVLLPPGEEFSTWALFLVNLANIVVIMMLLLLAYPLAFFGSRLPDRLVKVELMRFMLRGPATGVIALTVILLTEPTTQIIGVIGRDFMPFAVVAFILLWQWGVALTLPWLERRLIYNEEDDEQLAKLQNLSDRLLTRTDLLQLMEATLEATCDYLRVECAFVASVTRDEPYVVKTVGTPKRDTDDLLPEVNAMLGSLDEPYVPHRLYDYWIVPLFSARVTDEDDQQALIGVMGVEGNDEMLDLQGDDAEMVRVFIRRAARTLDDLMLQREIYAALEGLLPQISITRSRALEVEYRPGRNGRPQTPSPERGQIVEQVHAALRHYWGGPGLTNSRLMELQVVKDHMHGENGVKALREVLLEAIESLRPDGERDFKSPEWLLYNILTLRFIDSKRAKDTARRLYISEANLYRKQSAAIRAVADVIFEMEQEAQASSS